MRHDEVKRSPRIVFRNCHIRRCRLLAPPFVATFAHTLCRCSLSLELCYSNYFLPSTEPLRFYHAQLFSTLSLLLSILLSFPFLPPFAHIFDHPSSFFSVKVTCRLFLGLAVRYCYVWVVSLSFRRRSNSSRSTPLRDTFVGISYWYPPRPSPEYPWQCTKTSIWVFFAIPWRWARLGEIEQHWNAFYRRKYVKQCRRLVTWCRIWCVHWNTHFQIQELTETARTELNALAKVAAFWENP